MNNCDGVSGIEITTSRNVSAPKWIKEASKTAHALGVEVDGYGHPPVARGIKMAT